MGYTYLGIDISTVGTLYARMYKTTTLVGGKAVAVFLSTSASYLPISASFELEHDTIRALVGLVH